MGESLSAPEATTIARRHCLSVSIVAGLVMAADGAVVILVGGIFFLIYMQWDHDKLQIYSVAIALMAGLIAFSLRYADLYDLNVILSWPSHIGRIAINSGIAILVLTGLAFVSKLSDSFSRIWLVGTYATSLWLICASRGAVAVLLRKRACLGTITRNIALVGAGENAKILVGHLLAHNVPCRRLVGVFDDRRSRVPLGFEGCPLLGNLNDFVRYVEHGQIDDVIMTLPWYADNRLVEMAQKLRDLPVDVYLGFDLAAYRFPNSIRKNYFGVPVMEISTAPCSGWNGVAKSVMDWTLAFAILVITSPLLLCIAVMIKLDSNGPILFRQKRYGFNNRLIEVAKFRTMYHHMRDDEATTLTSRHDQRVTSVGRFLRRTSLDELPQLLNVLKGDMSLVGPRPHATKARANGKLYREVVIRYGSRHRVKPGITGWAQINGWRGETDSEEKIQRRVEHDLFYIEKWSIWFDLKILVKTALIAWRQDNAF